LGYYALWYRLDPKDSRKFFQQTIYLCKDAGATNSDTYRFVKQTKSNPPRSHLINYSRCLYALASHPETSYEDLKNLRTELQLARTQPYYAIQPIDTPKARYDTARGAPTTVDYPAPMSTRNCMICAECKISFCFNFSEYLSICSHQLAAW